MWNVIAAHWSYEPEPHAHRTKDSGALKISAAKHRQNQGMEPVLNIRNRLSPYSPRLA